MYVGTERDKLGNEMSQVARDSGIAAAKRLLTAEFGGFTAEPVRGGYKYHDGNMVEEASLRIDIVVPRELDYKVRPAVGKVRDLMRQESVLLSSVQVSSELV
jgi:hypothetical protein